jgi:hypothetical protein
MNAPSLWELYREMLDIRSYYKRPATRIRMHPQTRADLAAVSRGVEMHSQIGSVAVFGYQDRETLFGVPLVQDDTLEPGTFVVEYVLDVGMETY